MPTQDPIKSSTSSWYRSVFFAPLVALWFGALAFATYDIKHDERLRDVSSDAWMPETARNYLVGVTYNDIGAPYGCTSDCAHEEYGFANARLSHVTLEEHCNGRAYERIEHEKGCRAYLTTLKATIAEFRKEKIGPFFISVREDKLFDDLILLYERSTGVTLQDR